MIAKRSARYARSRGDAMQDNAFRLRPRFLPDVPTLAYLGVMENFREEGPKRLALRCCAIVALFLVSVVQPLL